MTSRKLDELATDIDDASTDVEDLQADPDADDTGKLAEIHDELEKASDTIDEIENNDT